MEEGFWCGNRAIDVGSSPHGRTCMNIQGANTESFYKFLRGQENLGSNIKLAYGALHAMVENEGATLPDKEISSIALPIGDEPWGNRKTRWRTIKRRVPLVRDFIAQMALVLVTSAFEDFVSNVISEHSRYSGFSGQEPPSKPLLDQENDSRDPLRHLYSSLQWDAQPIQYLLPLYDYFILARNCVVHRAGRASDALVEKAGSGRLQDCLENWPSRPGKKLPQLPQIQEGHDIPFLPRHAILFSEVCQRAARDINSRLLEYLGADGIVYMAAYHGLLADDRIKTNARRSPEQIINLILTERCRASVPDKYEVIGILKKLNAWNRCRTKYNKLFPNAKLAK